MYSLKVRANLIETLPGPQEAKESISEAGTEPNTSSAARNTASAEREPHGSNKDGIDEIDQVTFSAGNPRVEHITGVVHLYRHIPRVDEQQEQGPNQETQPQQQISHNISTATQNGRTVNEINPESDHLDSPFSSPTFPVSEFPTKAKSYPSFVVVDEIGK